MDNNDTIARMLENHQKTSFDEADESVAMQTPVAQTKEQELDQMVDRLFEEYDLPLARHDVVTDVSSSLKRLLGQAQYNRTEANGSRMMGRHVLRINDDHFGQDSWEDTVRHELAHIAAYADHGRSDGHGPQWKAWARRLDCEPTRCGNEVATEARYKIECLECGNTNGRHRMCKIIKKVALYSCGRCKGNLFAYENGHRPDNPDAKSYV